MIALGHSSPAARRGSHGGFTALAVCLLLSGMSGLVYEVAWMRSLELVFGSTTFAVATVLASFMGGLALGAWWMGARMRRLARFHPLRIYAVLEILLAIAGLLVPLALRVQAPIYRALAGALPDSLLAPALVRLLLCVVILLVPTVLMGATLPAVSAFCGNAGDAGRRVGRLYAVNTFGAVLGCAGAGMLLLPLLGLQRTQWIAVGLNAAAACGALLIARAGAASAALEVPVPEVEAPETPPAEQRLLVAAYALSGVTAMLYEVAWSRLLVLVLGSSTYATTIMLATFLLGLALGAAAGVRLLTMVRPPLLLAGLCQIVVAVATFLSLYLVQELPYLYHLVYDALQPSPHGLLGVQWLLAAALMIVPTLALGAMFPVTLEGLRPAGGRAPRVVGRAYAWNTIGAIAGSLAAGFFLIPGAGTRATLLAGIVMNAGIAAALVMSRGAAPVQPGAGLAGAGTRRALAAALVLFAANALIAAPRFRPEILSSGMFRYVERYRGLDRAGYQKLARESRGEILMFDEGLTCTVTVSRTTSLLSMAINGKPDASVPPGLPDPYAGAAPPPRRSDLATQVLVAQIPLLLAPETADVMVIGLGSGVSLGSVLRHPVRGVDCVELEDAVVRASRFFDSHSGGPLRDPRVRLIVNDARNQLLLAQRSYDVIVSEPSNPWLAGSAGLFTRDFFRIAASRLKPAGVFAQWVQMYELHPEDFLAILRSFHQVFPEVHLFRVDEDAVILGSLRPLPIDPVRAAGRGTPRVLADLARVQVRSPEELLSHYWAGGDDLARALPAGPLNTDDNMRIEFAAPLRMLSRDPEGLRAQTSALAALFDGRTAGLIGRLALPGGDPQRAATFWSRIAIAALARSDAPRGLMYADQSLALHPGAAAAAARGEALVRMERKEEALECWRRALRDFPRDPDIRRALAVFHLQHEEFAEARTHAADLVRRQPDSPDARLLLARAARGLGDARGVLAAIGPSALASGAAAERGAPDRGRGSAGPGRDAPDAASPELDALLGWALAERGQPLEAIDPLRRHLERTPGDAAARRLLVEALRRSGRADAAAAAARPLQPDSGRLASERLAAGRAAWDAGDHAAGRAALEEAYEFDPDTGAVAFALARARFRTGDAAGAIALVRSFLAGHRDHPWAVGYLGELLATTGRPEEARVMGGRHIALTGRPWDSIEAAAGEGR